MPSYWSGTTLADVLPQPVQGYPIVSATSRPINLGDADVLIELVIGEVHGAIAAAGYAVPVASESPDGYSYVRKVVRDGAAFEILKQFPGQMTTANEYKYAYRRSLDEIRNGKQPILAPGSSGEAGRALPRGAGIPSAVVTATWAP